MLIIRLDNSFTILSKLPMNKISIIISLISLSFSSFAQQGKMSFSDFVGIGTNNPPYRLTLQGSENTGNPDRRTFLSLYNTAQTDASLVSMRLQTGTSNTVTFLSQASSIYGTAYYGNEYADYGQLWSTGTGLILRAGGNATNDGIIKFQTGYAVQGGSNERMRVSGNGNVGIGTNNPGYKLAIQGDGSTNTSGNDGRTLLSLKGTDQSNAALVSLRLQSGTSTTTTLLTQASSVYGINNYGTDYADFGQLWSNGAGLILRAGAGNTNSGVIKFQTGLASQGSSNERMRISGNGNVGIGTQNPVAKLQVTDGDVYIENPNKGIILKSPSGNCYRVTIDDAGNFVRTAITCPN